MKQCDPGVASFYKKGYKQDGVWYINQFYITDTSIIPQMKGTYIDDSLTVPEGKFEWYYINGAVKQKGQYIRGKKVGVWRSYEKNGMLQDSSFFINDIPAKWSYTWNDGILSSKGIYDSEGNGSGWEEEYWKNNIVQACGKRITGGLKDSIWCYRDKNGVLRSKENYYRGALITAECFDIQGNPQKGDCDTSSYPKFPSVLLSQHIGESLKYPKDAREAEREGTVEIAFTITEEGRIEDVHPEFSTYRLTPSCIKEAVRVVSLMPPVKPIIVHNVTHKVYYTVPISFKLQ